MSQILSNASAPKTQADEKSHLLFLQTDAASRYCPELLLLCSLHILSYPIPMPDPG